MYKAEKGAIWESEKGNYFSHFILFLLRFKNALLAKGLAITRKFLFFNEYIYFPMSTEM